MTNGPHVVGDRSRSSETTEQSADPGEADRPPIEDMSTSAKLVYFVLEREGTLSTSAVAAETYLSRNAARRQLAYLNRTAYVESRQNLRNPNEKVHTLTSTASASGGDTAGDRHD